MEKLADLRREFFGIKLDENTVPKAPFEFFKIWLENALTAKIEDANSFVLATLDAQAQPQTRVLLLKDFSDAGLIFYTNFASDKGKQLAINPKVSMLFFWKELYRQVRINGEVEPISDEQANAYFATRPRESQLGAIASNQSSRVTKKELQESFISAEQKYKHLAKIPKPETWGGYLVKPKYFEFWQGQAGRFHDRICYQKSNPDANQNGEQNGEWEIYRLAP